MLKTLGALFIVLSGSLIGLYQATKLSNRVKFLEEYLQLITFAETQIKYSSRTIEEIFLQFGQNKYLCFIDEFLHRLCDELSVNEAWCKSVDSISKSYGLKKNDISLIKSFGKNLGVTDFDGQISNCEIMIENTKRNIAEAIDCKNKKYKIFCLIGISGGACTALLLI